jgi:hypothetical protein
MLTDERIKGLLDEPKPEVDSQELRRALNSAAVRRCYRRAKARVKGERGSWFVVHLRQNTLDPYDFSVILTFLPPTGAEINLRRHNGRNHRHRNKLEGTSFTNSFHIHEATERYQEAGHDIDGYARATTDFHDLATALDAMLAAANFARPAQGSLQT